MYVIKDHIIQSFFDYYDLYSFPTRRSSDLPKVAKVIGPGSPWVAAAKRLVSHVIDTGTPAGPSELIVLADDTIDRKSTRLNSSHLVISYAVFCMIYKIFNKF